MNDSTFNATAVARPSDHVLVESLLEAPTRARPTAKSTHRGSGRIFQRGTRWWIAYYVQRDGRSVEVRESAGTTEVDARRALKRRQDELSAHRIGARRFQGPRQERITVRQLLDELERHYELLNLSSLQRLRSHLKHITRFFGNDRALEVTPTRVNQYMELRQRERAANATINREVDGLQRAFTLAREQETLAAVPYFKSLPENNARQGF